MFKDYDKYLSMSLKVYLFVLICIFIMKLVGLDYFGIDLDNPIMVKLCIIFQNPILRDSMYLAFLTICQYLMVSMIIKDKSKKIKKYMFITLPFTYLVHYIKGLLVNYGIVTILLELIYLFTLCVIYTRSISKTFIKRFFVITFLNILFQMISSITRFNYSGRYITEFLPSLILMIDYFILLLIAQNITFNMKGGIKCYLDQVGLFLQKKLNLKKSLKKLQKNWHNFKKLDKVTKLTNIIYLILSLFWNVFNVVLILFVAMLNDTFIECIFILTSFWLSKGKFGKAFHFKSMSYCFIVSNLSYYVLNRLTTPLGISIIIPIMLGVGLSYVTSKFVKKTYKPLYRGMSPELFEETILQVTDKDSHKYKICYDFYINKKSIIALSMKYNYTEAGIRKIKDRINKQIKGLN